MRFMVYRYFKVLGCSGLKRLLSSVTGSKRLEESYQFIPSAARYCLDKLRQDWSQRQPLKDKTVLLNMHLTTITLAVIDIFHQSQARLEVIVARNWFNRCLRGRLSFKPIFLYWRRFPNINVVIITILSMIAAAG